ncbi:probable LRR receptor-like serine/threonine-protein kinase RFK1 isoform X2 [Prosopis cineraria]|uniref:probable LRR receptor-like serine/threonine-protein kinase RFK1 isoform X2 n=1 Tax=Prosopis cineraria TaxID=364024 RepID=UPI00240EDC53|nr:probable LRR receptor-like serine/threonine-protein kinase RFK1 isoform X2 [Prosopis cineraria]
MQVFNFFELLLLALTCFQLLGISHESRLPQDEAELSPESERRLDCDCRFENNTVCHVVKMTLKRLSLPGMLPPQLVKLPYLREIDFAYNLFTGSIPKEWALMNLTSISLLVNRLSGEIPNHLGNITSLTYLMLEANQFSGVIPPDLGSLINLQTLVLSSNKLTGSLPGELAGLQNLTDFRINDNNFNGTIPNFIQNWKLLRRLEMHASGLEGPIPSNISLLENLAQLRISDINSPSQGFPLLENMPKMETLVLRNCNLTGEIPLYIWTMTNLATLDLSFNKIVGHIPPVINTRRLRYMYLTGNMLSGNVPKFLKGGSSIDLSYNNFTWQGHEQPACQNNRNLDLNLFRSFRRKNKLEEYVPCLENFSCQQYSTCLHINSGGINVKVTENKGETLYLGDGNVGGGAATYHYSNTYNWGFSSTGDFMDDFNSQNIRYIVSLPSSNMPKLYTTARISPLSLTYFHNCMENGNYTVNLHFSEIQFTNDNTYTSLGKRIFDIYVQEQLIWKDFNIESKTTVARKPLIQPIHNVSVTNNVLEIRFQWAGKGTTRIPDIGVYGPIVSALSVVSDSRPCSNGGKKGAVNKFIAIGISALFLMLFMAGIIWWKGCFREKLQKTEDIQTGTFSFKLMRAATDDFSYDNKIGEGGFGPVYKGQLPDGTVIAVKQLSSMSRQGNREFLNEIGIISCLQHPNLVKLYGSCIEGDQLLLVYEYMENNNLARALFGNENNRIQLDWPTRVRICIGIAKGLAFLHEESRLQIVHRDIKATNVLLDGNLNPKISDFGLAKLNDTEKTHITTRIAGTIGYMAPEYALWGHLTFKADVYSFGVLALEIVTGKSNNNYVPDNGAVCLLDWACRLEQSGKLMELVDERMGSNVNEREAEEVLKVALLCTNASPSLRPTMSEVVSMLEGQMDIPDVVPEPGACNEDLRFKALRDLDQWSRRSLNGNQTQSSVSVHTFSLEIGNTNTACSVDCVDHQLVHRTEISPSKASSTP